MWKLQRLNLHPDWFEQPTIAEQLMDCVTVKYRKQSETHVSVVITGLLLGHSNSCRHTHKHTYKNTRRVCSESVDGVGLETVQKVAQLQFRMSPRVFFVSSSTV